MIKEELLKEAEGWFPNEARYPRELLSNVSKSIDWDITQAFAFVVDLLEDVNAHDEAKRVNDLLSRRPEEPGEEEDYTPEDGNPEDDSNWVGHKSHY